MEIAYRPGQENERADALSRREQDMPKDQSDERLQHRYMQLLKPATYATADEDSIIMYPAQVLLQELPQERLPQDERTELEVL